MVVVLVVVNGAVPAIVVRLDESVPAIVRLVVASVPLLHAVGLLSLREDRSPANHWLKQ